MWLSFFQFYTLFQCCLRFKVRKSTGDLREPQRDYHQLLRGQAHKCLRGIIQRQDQGIEVAVQRGRWHQDLHVQSRIKFVSLGSADNSLHNREQVNFGYVYVIYWFVIFYESIVNYPCSERHPRGLRWEQEFLIGFRWPEKQHLCLKNDRKRDGSGMRRKNGILSYNFPPHSHLSSFVMIDNQ